MRFDHIPAKTVRFWALLDTSVTWMLAIPPLAPKFISFLYWANGLVGGGTTPPAFEPIHLLFVSLTGSLVTTWVIARLLNPIGLLAVIDGWARLWVGATLIWLILGYGAPPILWLFVFTEWIGTVAQLRAAYAKH